MRAELLILTLILSSCTAITLDDLTFACTHDDECAHGTRCHPLTSTCIAPRCGDGAVDPGETCDDGNAVTGDGCSAACALEPHAACAGQPSSCAICGDRIARAPLETCDDGNTAVGDGCSATCQAEPGYLCDETGCTRCGDGVRTAQESCDDAGASGGCVDCRVRFGFTCTATLGEASRCTRLHFQAIAAGFRHTCGLDAEGRVTCRGSNTAAEEDNRVTGQATPPADLPPLATISAGSLHTCGITAADNRAICWGSNYYVDDSHADHVVNQATVPAELGPVRELVAGNVHTCAVKTDGAIRCWGENEYTQATPTTTDPVHDLSLGTYHTCAVRDADRRPFCFGLGDLRLRAPDVEVIALSLGNFHACVVTTGGELRCWGRDTTSARVMPPSGADFADVVSGHYFNCALRRSGFVRCFGDPQRSPAALSPPDEPFVALSASVEHACGLRADGTATCWGDPRAFSD